MEMNRVSVRNVVLGEGKPKVCVPLVARTEGELTEQLKSLAGLNFDVLEFRADFLDRVEETGFVLACCRLIRNALPDVPLLFTFRRVEEGGEHPLESAAYFGLLHQVAESGLADLLDVELFTDEARIAEIVSAARQHGVKVVLCNHDFDKTPPKDEIVRRLRRMQDLGADICKIAVMPHSAADVLVLLEATQMMFNCFAKQPLVTMSMGRLGMVSRLCGEVFGSAMTFGAAGKTSAPGQVALDDLNLILDVLSDKKAV
ncbi:type I 3-dehydroquinate dehydratase [Neisseria weaveri]|uniref:type I 3-dehydroquinate dehydratase n=1 Tax=Neisseria weaveri TaxID=28091 RepID=UPI000D321DF7|nr:type I 3-dehydroquinate dehydratase [Neisseria weaveri]